MVSGAENVPKSAQMPQAPMFGPFNMIHGSAEFMDQLNHLLFWEIKTLLIILSSGMVNTMLCHCLDILGTWRLIPRCSYLLLSTWHVLLSSTPLEGTLLSSYLPF